MNLQMISETLGLIDVGYTLESYPYPYPGGPVTLDHCIRILPDGSEMDVYEVLTDAEIEEIKDTVLEHEQGKYERRQAAIEDAAEAKMLQRKGVW